ncbi:FAD-dependent oxidoreductase [Aliiroseovarius sp. KMU-50]|uniref:FAD-dependent oxidoreductase n=1 Tax=Aliiroseovarius salicola TaxID=3009082 RepID=A0ABT4W425_9RHOB|nr:FAD-dependent oxidoreductase [Aliiroseovarius sp. KMU-50]MDA5095272.1 FAD-dependent oxidoreductase [Aliiroseovarius sp. KMU-50]
MKPLDGQKFDVAIIGAGINGASTAQHLTAAGYSVLVVDQDDFSNGASSRSSRLLHCGLRHLADGTSVGKMLLRPDRFVRSMGTVRADMIARDEIARTIPERVNPINFALPIYKDDPYAPWQLDAAFALLRMTSPKGESLDYRRYKPDQFDQVPIAPRLRDPDKLQAVAVFREFIFDWPERIALDALFDARRMGAEVHNYMKVEELTSNEDDGWDLRLNPTRREGQPFWVSARMVLNLAGAWVDLVNAQTGNSAPRKCQGIKGIHIAVQLPPEFRDWGVFTYNSLGEPLYCLPWRGYHYVGLTRTKFFGDATGVHATDQEIDWMLGETNRCLPSLSLTRKDVLYSWAGVNPLTFDKEQDLGSREIKIHDLASDGMKGMFTLTGGPVVTHRRVAHRFVDRIRPILPPSLAPKEIRYTSAEITNSKGAVSSEAIADSARTENPESLADLMMRRLGLGWEADQGLAAAEQVAQVAAPHMGWSDKDIENELHAYQVHLQRDRRKPSIE